MPSEILITPKSGEPQILFSGSGNVTPIELNVLSNYQSATGSGTALLFEGTQGQLFSITDNLSSGVIFSVSDITGLPLFEINASGDVRIGEYARFVGVGTGVPQFQLDVYGTGNFRGNIRVGSGIFLTNGSNGFSILQDSRSYLVTEQGGGWGGWTLGNMNSTQDIVSFVAGGGESNVKLRIDGQLQWSSSSSWNGLAGQTPDLILRRDGPNILGQRNFTSPQSLRVYNTFTNSGNWEGAVLDWQTTANTFRFGTNHGTSGADRAIEFIMGGSGVYRIETNGNHLFRSNGGSIVTGAGYAYSFQSNMNVTWMQITNSGTSVNTHGAFFGLNVNEFDLWNFQGGGIRLYTSTATGQGQNTFTLSNRGNIKHCPVGQTSGSPIVLEIVAPPTSGVPSGESPDILFNLGRNILLTSGNNQRETSVLIVPPTYSNVATGVITSGVTLRISGPPAAGSGTSITNSFALVVDSGFSSFGRIFASDGANSIETSSWGGAGFMVRQGGNVIVGLGGGGIRLTAGAKVAFCSDPSINTEESTLIRDTSNTINLRNSTTPQTFRVSNTFTTTGNFEAFQIKANATQYELSSAVGATGSNRNIVIGHTNSSGTFNGSFTVGISGNISATGLIDNSTELTYSPSGSITLPLAKNHQTLNLISTTGNPTITLQTPQNSSAGTLIIKQGTTSRAINWGVSTGVLVWLGTQPTWASDPTGCYRVMTWRYNPSLLTTLVAVTESGI